MNNFLKYTLFLTFLLCPFLLAGQANILEKEFTLRKDITKTGEALSYLSRATGYYFTYDSDLVNPDRVFGQISVPLPLRSILDKVFDDPLIRYSVIQNHIIIYKEKIREEPIPVSESTLQVLTVTGIVTDFESGERLPFATIGLKNMGTGTISNYNGEFGLKILQENMSDTLSVSFLGYRNRLIPVKSISENNLTIGMVRDYIPIAEIIIRVQDPQEIIKRVRENIKRNYGTEPAILSGFYREAVQKKDQLQMLSEAVLSIYKSPYANSFQSDQIKVLKSRKIENTGNSDTLVIRLKGGLGSSLELDGVKKMFDFLAPDNLVYYSLSLTDIVTIDDQNAYVIDFVQNPGLDFPLFEGSVYINTDNYAVLLAEFRLYPPLIGKAGESFVSGQTRGYVIKPRSVAYRISYRNINGRYFLNHVRGDLEFSTRRTRKLFTSPYSVFFELAVTSTDTTNVTRFDKDEVLGLQEVFSRSIGDYDSEFWGDFNFLRPDDDLIEGLKAIIHRINEQEK